MALAAAEADEHAAVDDDSIESTYDAHQDKPVRSGS